MKKTLFLLAVVCSFATMAAEDNSSAPSDVTVVLSGNCDVKADKVGTYTSKYYKGEYSETSTAYKELKGCGGNAGTHLTLREWGEDVNNFNIIIEGDAPGEDVLDVDNINVREDKDNRTQICNDVYAGDGHSGNTGQNTPALNVHGNVHIQMRGGYLDGSIAGAGRIGEVKGDVVIDMVNGYCRYGIRGAGGNNVEENVGGNVEGDVTINMSGGMIGLKKGSRASITGAGYGSPPGQTHWSSVMQNRSYKNSLKHL